MPTVASPSNPFLTLPLAFDPERYYGSQVWADFALQGISNTPPRSMEMIGLPGMGKSFLLQYLEHKNGALKRNSKALQPPYKNSPDLVFPLLVQFRLLPGDTHPFVYLYRRFCEQYPKYRERVKDSVKLPGFDYVANLRDPDQATSLLEDILTTLKDQSIRPAFLFDDFHLAFCLLNQEETTRLRPWRDRVAFILTTERRLDKVNAEAAGSPFYQTLPVVRFGGLTAAESRVLIKKPAEQAKWSFHPEDIEFALAYADGHPHLLILASSALWDSRNSLGIGHDKNVAVSKEYPEILRGHFKEKFRPAFQMYWEHLDEVEQRALQASASSKQVIGDDYAALAFLNQLGLVKFDRKSKSYEPFSLLFKEFLESTVISRSPENDELRLTGIEAGLFEHLKAHVNKVCSFEELAREVWKQEPTGSELLQRRVQVAVSRLRKRLQETQEGDIISVRKKGYRFTS